jgi:hypothetical protein
MINPNLEESEASAMQLAPLDPAPQAERLLISLEEKDEILSAWVAEAERRGDAYERGEMETIDFDEAIAHLRARLNSAT